MLIARAGRNISYLFRGIDFMGRENGLWAIGGWGAEEAMLGPSLFLKNSNFAHWFRLRAIAAGVG